MGPTTIEPPEQEPREPPEQEPPELPEQEPPEPPRQALGPGSGLDHAMAAGGQRAASLRDVILGGQDGLVNVLGLVLGMAAATGDTRVIVTAGLAAMMAESIAMAGVAFTATGAEGAWTRQESKRLRREVSQRAERAAADQVEDMARAGAGPAVTVAVARALELDRERWLGELDRVLGAMSPVRETRPIVAALVVGVSTVVGSAVPLLPFILLPVGTAVWLAVAAGAVVLFAVGAYRAWSVGGSLLRAGAEMAVIGLVSALAGYLIGIALRAPAGA